MTDPSPGTVPATSGSVVAFEHVTKRYGDGPPAVTDLSLEIGAGEVCVLVGPSGCGKTTTMKMVNRLVEPTNGRVTIDGEDVASLPPVELRRRIGYVIQQVGLFPHLTVGDNVAVVPRLLGWSPPSITERVEELLELVGLDPGTYRARYPAALSGGERQRVGVARAMAADPTVLLMDEPFGAVDPIRRERLQNDLLRLQARLRKTIVFVTHDVDEAIKMADRIAILQVGGVLAQYDSPDRLLAAPANAFVERFVGADRGLKRLSLARVGDLELEVPSTVTIGEPIQAARARMPGGVGWILVTDSRRRAVGWVNVSDLAGDGSVTEDMAIPGSALLQPESTLRDALSAMLASSVQTGVVVDANDELLGVVHVNAISATLQDGGVGGVTQDFFRLDWVIDNLGMLADRTAEHVVLTVIAMVGGILIAFPVTLFIHRRRRLIGPVLGFSGILYAVPSLALFAFLIPVTGIGLLTAEIALVSYTLLILIRNGLAGLDGVEPEIVEAATGLGHTPRQRLWRVELPLATPVIMAGIRIATVTTIGLVAVTALIGQGGLGFVIITLGIRRQFETAIVVGVILSVLLAVLADRGLVLLERMLTPWARARAEGA